MIDTRLSAASSARLVGSVDTSTSKPLAFRRCRERAVRSASSPARRGISSMAISGRAEAKADAGPLRARESMRPRTASPDRSRTFVKYDSPRSASLATASTICLSKVVLPKPPGALTIAMPVSASLESTSRTSSPRSTVRWPLAVGLSSAACRRWRAGTGAGRSLCPASVSAGLGSCGSSSSAALHAGKTAAGASSTSGAPVTDGRSPPSSQARVSQPSAKGSRLSSSTARSLQSRIGMSSCDAATFLCAAEGTPESSSSCRTIAGTNSGCVTGSFEVVVAEPESSP